MPQNLAEWLGVLGFGLSVVLALFGVWKYRQENRERVRVDLRFQTGLSVSSPLIATVVNVGRTTVHLNRVELQLGPKHPKTGQSVCSIPLTMVGKGLGSPARVPSVLGVGEEREYYVPDGHPVLPRFAAADPNQLRLVVHSNRGLIARVCGDEVACYLSKSASYQPARESAVEGTQPERHGNGQ